MRKTTSGFTLVELLIAIVVIAILASISVVAYSGIQNRAIATKIASDVSQYAKLSELHYMDTGRAPLATGYPDGLARSCLGTTESLPAEGPYAEGQCLFDNNGWGNGASVDEALIDALRPYGNPPEDVTFSTVNNTQYSADHLYRGVVYITNWNSPDANISYKNTMFFRWFMKGDMPCGAAEKTYLDEGDYTKCELNMSRPEPR